jgi:hypothetical protein
MNSRRVLWIVLAWVAAISALHLRLNFDWASYENDSLPREKRKLNVAYIPVT